jgi:hypothetical protein
MNLISPQQFKKLNESVFDEMSDILKKEQQFGPLKGYVQMAEEMYHDQSEYLILKRYFQLAIPAADQDVGLEDPEVISLCRELLDALRVAKKPEK